MGRREDLQRTIEKAERELSILNSLPDFEGIRNGSIVSVVTRYEDGDRRVFIGLKSMGLWDFTADSIKLRATSDQVIEWMTFIYGMVTAVTEVGWVDTFEPEIVDIEGMMLDRMAGPVCEVPDSDCDCGCSGEAHA